MATVQEIWAGSPTLTIGQAYNRTQSGAYDYYTFEATVGTRYRIDIEGSSIGKGTLDRPNLSVNDPDFSTADQGRGVGMDARVYYTAKETETIYLKQTLMNETDNVGDSYVITVSTAPIEDDFGDDASSANTINAGTTISGELETPGDSDWFAITLTSGNVYTFDLNGYSSGTGTLLDPYIEIYASPTATSAVRLVRYDDDSGVGNNASATYMPTESGVYYIKAKSGGLPSDFVDNFKGLVVGIRANVEDSDPGTYSLSITESKMTTGSNGVTITDVNLGVYRFYNNATGTHFYSSAYSEAVSVNENLPAFSYENVAFKGVDSSDSSAVPFYRFYNTLTGTHFFTSDSAEKDSVIANLPQYNYEGIAYYLHNAPDANDIALHRFFNTQTGTHFYTANESEKTTVINTLIDYSYEGIVGYVDIA